jgi:hypothetical protein
VKVGFGCGDLRRRLGLNGKSGMPDGAVPPTYASWVLDSMDRWLARTFSAAMELDRWVMDHLTDAVTDHVMPVADRAVQRGRRMLSSHRPDSR